MARPLIIPRKIGSTLKLTCTYKTYIDGVLTPTSLLGVDNVSATLRDSLGVIKRTLDYTVVNSETGIYRLSLAEVIDLPAGDYTMDIKYTFTSGDVEIVPSEGSVVIRVSGR